jgi:hypothetical protein
MVSKLREAEVLARRHGAVCENCTGVTSNQPFSNRLYCIRGGQRRVAVG